MENIFNKSELLIQINKIRGKMIEIGLKKGLNSTETITISQQLDELMLFYQSGKMINNEKKKFYVQEYTSFYDQ
jgi:hypothetical protein